MNRGAIVFRKKETKSLKEMGVKEVRIFDGYMEFIKYDGSGVTVQLHPLRDALKKYLWGWLR
ncbi:hypothetical protein ACI3E1_06145 [Ligilactobacillus sp. LYQ139]